MSSSQEKAIRNHRRRLRERGLKRAEVEVAEADAVLLRQLARILREDGDLADQIRRQLAAMVSPAATDLKALLAEAPLDGIRITRSKDRGRTVEL